MTSMTHQSLVEKLDSNIMGLIFVRTFAITPPPPYQLPDWRVSPFHDQYQYK